MERLDGMASYTTLINDHRDYELDANGNLMRDTTPASRCRVRILARRGHWPFDPDLGSRIHDAKSLGEAKRRIRQWAQEALGPLIDEGAISSVDIGEVEAAEKEGEFNAQLMIGLPDGTVEQIDVMGTIRIAA